MGRIGNPRWLGLVMLGSCALGLTGAALAGPPIGARGAFRLDLHAAHAAHAAPHPTLDLRPALDAANAAEKPPSAFPSSLHRQTLGAQEEIRLPELGSASSQARSRGRAEEFVQRAHREGLPLARLWENKSALVSLGLNQRGKPGLWIIQKIH
jgi:hypothetical protein